jgi:hypothetical protein
MIDARRVLLVGLSLLGCARPDPASVPEPHDAAPSDVAPSPAPREPAAAQPTPPPASPPVAATPQVDPAAPTHPSAPLDDAAGRSRAEILARWGEPDDREAGRWSYRFPRPPGCTDREIVYVLVFRGEQVAKVERSTRQTGKHCEPSFSP